MGGSFVYSLVAREQSLVVAGLDVIANQLPFPVLGIDSDNDSVIISDTLTEYCAERGIEFTSKGLMDIIGININGFCANQIMSIRGAFYDRTIAKSEKEVYKGKVGKRDGSVLIWRLRNLCSSAWSRCRTPEGPEGSDIPFKPFCV